jgi:hypothetical protein
MTTALTVDDLVAIVLGAMDAPETGGRHGSDTRPVYSSKLLAVAERAGIPPRVLWQDIAERGHIATSRQMGGDGKRYPRGRAARARHDAVVAWVSEGGRSQRLVAEELGVSQPTVCRALRRWRA